MSPAAVANAAYPAIAIATLHQAINGRQSVVFSTTLEIRGVCALPGRPKAKRMRPARFSANAYSGLKAVPQAG